MVMLEGEMLLLQIRCEVKKGILVIRLPWCCKCLHRCSQHPPGGRGEAGGAPLRGRLPLSDEEVRGTSR